MWLPGTKRLSNLSVISLFVVLLILFVVFATISFSLHKQQADTKAWTADQSAPTGAPVSIPTTELIVALMPTVTPEPTVTAMNTIAPKSKSNTIFNFNLFLHGIGKGGDSANRQAAGNLDPVHKTVSFAVEVYDKQNILAASLSADLVYTTSSGSFRGTVDLGQALANGAYTVRAKADRYLKTTLPGTADVTAGEEIDMYRTVLPAGDMNNDNEINVLDYNLMAGCFGDLSPAKDCKSSTNADLNDDGGVNQLDYDLFMRELTGREGE